MESLSGFTKCSRCGSKLVVPIIIERGIYACKNCNNTFFCELNLAKCNQKVDPMEGQHKDEGKSRVDLIDPYMLEQMGHVLAFGAEKYSPDNWKHGIKHRKLIGSLLRHIYSYMRGIDNDHESGLPHLAHAGCCLMMLMGMTQLHPELDDRFKLESK